MSNIITLDATNATVKAVVTQIKADMRGAGRYAAYVTEFGVTRETVKDHARALAVLVTPETAQKIDGKRTKFGNAVQAAGNGLRAALDKPEGESTTAGALLTKAGVKATREEVIAAWEAAQK